MIDLRTLVAERDHYLGVGYDIPTLRPEKRRRQPLPRPTARGAQADAIAKIRARAARERRGEEEARFSPELISEPAVWN